MEISQIINNNVVISKDEFGNEVVLFGKGIGFNGTKGKEIDSTKVIKTFILKDSSEVVQYQRIVQDLPYEVLSFGLKAVNYILECCSKKVSQKHLTLPLIDHIATTLERINEGMSFDYSILMNIRYLYKEEYKIARDICDMLESDFKISVPEAEANFITLHIIDSELDLESKDGYKATSIIELAIKVTEEYFSIELDKSTMDFSRFVTHLQFFAKRVIQQVPLNMGDLEIMEFICYKYPNAYKCSKEIVKRISEELALKVDENESMYLTIHIERLINK